MSKTWTLEQCEAFESTQNLVWVDVEFNRGSYLAALVSPPGQPPYFVNRSGRIRFPAAGANKVGSKVYPNLTSGPSGQTTRQPAASPAATAEEQEIAAMIKGISDQFPRKNGVAQ